MRGPVARLRPRPPGRPGRRPAAARGLPRRRRAAVGRRPRGRAARRARGPGRRRRRRPAARGRHLDHRGLEPVVAALVRGRLRGRFIGPLARAAPSATQCPNGSARLLALGATAAPHTIASWRRRTLAARAVPPAAALLGRRARRGEHLLGRELVGRVGHARDDLGGAHDVDGRRAHLADDLGQREVGLLLEGLARLGGGAARAVARLGRALRVVVGGGQASTPPGPARAPRRSGGRGRPGGRACSAGRGGRARACCAPRSPGGAACARSAPAGRGRRGAEARSGSSRAPWRGPPRARSGRRRWRAPSAARPRPARSRPRPAPSPPLRASRRDRGRPTGPRAPRSASGSGGKKRTPTASATAPPVSASRKRSGE